MTKVSTVNHAWYQMEDNSPTKQANETRTCRANKRANRARQFKSWEVRKQLNTTLNTLIYNLFYNYA